ncbi:MAG: NAD-dependent epimerase/dehydratase family protein [Candidatus Cloacimonadaceae bacterium]|jgi:nucleoside-diphosphate-sugar epimerase|nr:NAD-dependent epimerase/dehydratase family protein [Candidatus Cloacimonadota bacterium]MDX9949202.1 NAD-dependent epimerase/dehydratase family protein [Candidatus Syntrophosphaera sp.]NLN84948.1 NAD-dependent epimerase/dehydratase family protein [Candidatus Cloacimonadota bacterium]
MNILVTGSNGFVGSRLMWDFDHAGYHVAGIDISPNCNSEPHPKTLIGDIRDAKDLKSVNGAFELENNSEIDLIIHCAAAKHDFGIKRGEYFDHNKYGTRTLLDFAEKTGINKLIYLSTVAVFGHPEGPADENAPYAADHPYGESKLAGEELCIRWQEKDPARQLIVLRPTVIYGPNNFANMYKLMDTMHRRPIAMVGQGNHKKSVVSLDTMADMIMFSLSLLEPGFQHFNCVDEPYLSLHELMELIASQPGFRMPHLRIPASVAVGIGKVFDIPASLLGLDLPVNSDRMRKFSTATDFRAPKIREAGFVQKKSIADSIAEMCAWYLEHRKTTKGAVV